MAEGGFFYINQKLWYDNTSLHISERMVHIMHKELTYAEWLKNWINNKEIYVKEATAANYLQSLERHIIPMLGQLTLSELTEQKLQEAALLWLEKGRCDGNGGLSERTVRSMVMLVKHSLKAAAKEGYIPDRHYDILFPPNPQIQKLKVLSRTEQALLTQHVYLNLTPKNLGLLFCLHTGLRIGELCALQWGDIDLENKTVSVCRTIQRIYRRAPEGGSTRLVITTPKTAHSVRVVPISTLLFPILKKMHPGDGQAYLLTGDTNPTEPRTYRDYYNRLRNKLGISDVTFHGLRHTFATRLIESGADYKTVSELLGHATVNITLNLYVHPQMEQKRKAVELIGCCL